MATEETQKIKQLIDIDIIRSLHLPTHILKWLMKGNLYKMKDSGVMRLSSGVRGKKDHIYLDITSFGGDMDPAIFSTIKERLRPFILEYPSSQIVSEFHPHGQSVELLLVDDYYASLSASDKEKLGNEFVSMVATDGGFTIKDLLSKRDIQGDTFLKVPIDLDEKTAEKINGRIVVYKQTEVDGVYAPSDMGREMNKNAQL